MINSTPTHPPAPTSGQSVATGTDSPVAYHRMLATDRRRIGRGAAAILLLIVGSQLLSIGLTTGAAFLDAWLGTRPRAGFTPLTQAAGLISVALLTPWSMIILRLLYGRSRGSLSSVRHRLRFDLIGRAMVSVGPAVVVILIIQYWAPLPRTDWTHTETLWLLAIALVLTPLQAAGEEYGFRGLILQIAGSWSRHPRAGLVLGIAVSSVLFAWIHASTSGWLNLWYLIFAVGMAMITWRTGGIEVAITIHALYNTLSFVMDAALAVDPAVATDRSGTAVSATALLPAVVVVGAVIVVVWRTRRTGPARTAVPAHTE